MESNTTMDATQSPLSSTDMQGLPSTENDPSDMNEFLRALCDIQSIDIHELKAQFLQSSKPVNQNVADYLMQKKNYTLEALIKETNKIQTRLDEEQKFKTEYVNVFGKRNIKDLQKMMEELNGVKEKLKEETKRLEEKNRNLLEETQKALEEKSDALNRLGKHMRDQMTNNNPNIADSSDKNRPTKLGERYTEMYDNQWTNAFEALTEMRGQQEERAVEILLNLLIECYNFSRTTAEKQMHDLLILVSGDPKMQLGDEIKNHVRKARELADVTRADLLFQKCERHIKDKAESTRRYLDEKEMKKYLIECFQICWLMAIQDPPVVLGKEVKYADPFDTSMYKHYTRSGKRVKFVVWPPLLLHEGGPLLAKGIAQPIQENTDALVASKKIKSRYAWEEGDSTGIEEKPIVGTVKDEPSELPLMMTKTIKKHWRVTAHPTETTTSSPSYVAASHIYPMASANHQLTADHSRNTGAINGKDLVTISCKQCNDRAYSGLHSSHRSTLGTVEPENQSALRQRQRISSTGGASQSNTRSSKAQSTECEEIISSHTGSSSSNYAYDMTSKRRDFLVRLAHETRDHLLSTGQKSKQAQAHERVTAHSYEPLKIYERPEFNRFITKYKREGQSVTRKYFSKQYDRYLALYLENKRENGE